jgi:hypothetical protein
MLGCGKIIPEKKSVSFLVVFSASLPPVAGVPAGQIVLSRSLKLFDSPKLFKIAVRH